MKLRSRQEIARPADQVFDFVADASNNPRWQRGQISCVWVSPPPIEVGSIYEQRARFLGRTLTNRFVVVDFDPGRTIVLESREGTFPIKVRRTVEPIGEGRSLVKAEIDGEPGGAFRVVGPLLQRLAQRSVEGDYRRLKQLLEGEGRRPGRGG